MMDNGICCHTAYVADLPRGFASYLEKVLKRQWGSRRDTSNYGWGSPNTFFVVEHTLTGDTRKIFASNIIQDRRRVQLDSVRVLVGCKPIKHTLTFSLKLFHSIDTFLNKNQCKFITVENYEEIILKFVRAAQEFHVMKSSAIENV